MASGIYAIRNTVNGKQYIGSAVNIRSRWSLHKRSLCGAGHHSKKLQRAWEKYGVCAFEFRVLLLCAKKDLLYYEQRCLDALPSEYNVCRFAGSNFGRKMPEVGAANRARVWNEEARARIAAAHLGRKPGAETIAKLIAAGRGRKHTEETRAKLSAARRGKKMPPKSAETRAKLSAAGIGRKMPPLGAEARANISRRLIGNTYRRGKPTSAETRAKLSAAGRGRKQSPEAIANSVAARRGKKRGAEFRAKMSEVAKKRSTPERMARLTARAAEVNRGKPLSPETRAKISEKNTGKKFSAEHRARISAAAKQRSPETRANMSASQRASAARRKAAQATTLPLFAATQQDD